MSIVCIGDSLTFGYRVKETEGWVSVLSTKIKDHFLDDGIHVAKEIHSEIAEIILNSKVK